VTAESFGDQEFDTALRDLGFSGVEYLAKLLEEVPEEI